ncbi:unnamed protein product [Echinostoma caproni]|uniref:Uncharacterized protein n=1 Tax=Echinostoma caproni TaxID=27848 RepID=A0A183AKQ4_9TREM|nr:unnamed protein product [Echinostoma caproni]
MEGVLRFWPKTNSNKEVLFLNELKACLECASSSEFQIVAQLVFTQIARCIESLHFQVAERALFLWNDEYILALMAENLELVCPIVFPALNEAKNHWNKAADDARRRRENWKKLESAVQQGRFGATQGTVKSNVSELMPQSGSCRRMWTQPNFSPATVGSDPTAQTRVISKPDEPSSAGWTPSVRQPVRPWRSTDSTNPVPALNKVISSIDSTDDRENKKLVAANFVTITTESVSTTSVLNSATTTTTTTDSVSILKSFYSTPFKTVPIISPRPVAATTTVPALLTGTSNAPKTLVTSPKALGDSVSNEPSSIPTECRITVLIISPSVPFDDAFWIAVFLKRVAYQMLVRGANLSVKSKDPTPKQNTIVRRSNRRSPESGAPKVSQSGAKRTNRGSM